MSIADFVISTLVLIVFLGSSFFFGELWRLVRRPDGEP
jgi:hypothetical protein